MGLGLLQFVSGFLDSGFYNTVALDVDKSLKEEVLKFFKILVCICIINYYILVISFI